MSITTTAAVGFGIIIKGNDTETIERINQFSEGSDSLFESVVDILEILESEYLVADVTGSQILGYDDQDVVVVVADTYRDFDIMNSGFAGAFRINTGYVIPEGIEALREFCDKIELDITVGWLAWNKAS